MSSKYSKQLGFSLFELIITMTIAALLVAVAGPSFSDMIKNNRVTSYTNQFVGFLYLARSEAIKRSAIVTLCKSSNGTECTTNGGWDSGWILFEDRDNNAEPDSAQSMIRIHKGLPAGFTVTGNLNVDSRVSYNANGRIETLGGTISICDDRSTEDAGRNIVLISTGRFRVDTGIRCADAS